MLNGQKQERVCACHKMNFSDAGGRSPRLGELEEVEQINRSEGYRVLSLFVQTRVEFLLQH